MPKTKFQGIVFGIIMSYAMAYGMEVFNVAIKLGYNLKAGGFSSMTNRVFVEALKEASFMGVFVFIFSSLFGNRLGAKMAERRFSAEKDNPYLVRLMRQACTVAVMCPTMSMVAAILFSIVLGGSSWTQLPAIWTGTLLKNFPMAFLWNMYAAAPFTHWLFELIFERKQAQAHCLERNQASGPSSFSR